jgi:LysM domain
VALGGAFAGALAAAVLFLLWLERRAEAKPIWHAYLPEVPPA